MCCVSRWAVTGEQNTEPREKEAVRPAKPAMAVSESGIKEHNRQQRESQMW